MDERILERRREVRRQRHRRRRRRTIGVLVALLLVGGLVALERSSLVALNEVRVTGTRRLERAAVRKAADLRLGTSTLRLPLGEAERRVESLPLVADAVVRRTNPLVVEIRVEERRPVAVVVGRGGPALVDGEGVISEQGRRPGLPVIDLGGQRVPEPGASVADVAGLSTAHRVLRALPAELRDRVARYDAPAGDGLVLVLQDGPRVRFGRARAIEEKVRSLRAVQRDLGAHRVAVIDVRTPRTPVVEPTGIAATAS